MISLKKEPIGIRGGAYALETVLTIPMHQRLPGGFGTRGYDRDVTVKVRLFEKTNGDIAVMSEVEGAVIGG